MIKGEEEGKSDRSPHSQYLFLFGKLCLWMNRVSQQYIIKCVDRFVTYQCIAFLRDKNDGLALGSQNIMLLYL